MVEGMEGMEVAYLLIFKGYIKFQSSCMSCVCCGTTVGTCSYLICKTSYTYIHVCVCTRVHVYVKLHVCVHDVHVMY